MKKALVGPDSRITDIVAPGDEFPVHEAFVWMDAADAVTTSHTVVSGVITAPAANVSIPLADAVETEIRGNRALMAIVREAAADRAMTEQALIDAIKAMA